MHTRDSGESALEVNRRQFLRVAGGALGLSLAAACTPVVQGPSATRPTAGPTGTTTGTSALYPTYVPASSGPKPDSPASGVGYDDGFDKFPTNPVKAMPGDPPGTGSTVNIMSIALFPPPTPLAQNPAWQAVNKALNADVQFDVVTQADYPVKLGTIMASDMPGHGVHLRLRAARRARWRPPWLATVPAVQGRRPDTISGGRRREGLPEPGRDSHTAWQNAGCAYQGKLYLIPIHRYLPGRCSSRTSRPGTRNSARTTSPRTRTTSSARCQALTKPQQGFYGIAAAQDTVMHVATFASIFGAPNGWKLESDGKLVKDVETPEYKEARWPTLRDLFAAGVFHPDSLNMAATSSPARSFTRRSSPSIATPINGLAGRLAARDWVSFAVRPLPLFPAHDGGKTSHSSLVDTCGRPPSRRARPSARRSCCAS